MRHTNCAIISPAWTHSKVTATFAAHPPVIVTGFERTGRIHCMKPTAGFAR
ncbi:MAG: hypothetical protein H8E47_01245 [Anaerolineales bacterium]|nr:hypothetical protein [Anaerolineales bacterium]